MKTLLIIDAQYDFLPGGNLAIPNANEIIPEINKIIKSYDIIIATRDFHPSNHKSFASQHKGCNPGDVIILNDIEQVLWPDHCIQNTYGSEITNELKADLINKIIYKGTNSEISSYSGFFDNNNTISTGLHEYLQSKCIKNLDIVGLATNYCVKHTVLDALNLGYKVNLLTSACRGIDIIPGDVEKAVIEMKNAGATIIVNSDELRT